MQVTADGGCSRAWGEAPTGAAARLGQASIPRLGASYSGPSGHIYLEILIYQILLLVYQYADTPIILEEHLERRLEWQYRYRYEFGVSQGRTWQ